MVIKTYFEVSWTGPTIEVDSKGNVTKEGEVKGKLPVRCSSSGSGISAASDAAGPSVELPIALSGSNG